ncbi:14403_t:CDS:2 [Cetraspora pellucida]|uniref:14403_t:CDS:1 n=1 Tax=Cetraspora pellucida TaxID=1433469 RepID=A0ACA9LT43_9GLOM|nr:14403_t:CDS:2 [Cetraspora pellucida]
MRNQKLPLLLPTSPILNHSRGFIEIDKRRKEKIFKETFDKVGYPHEKKKDRIVLPCYLELIPFDSEIRSSERTIIDDNPNICKDVAKVTEGG